jgi:triosephosphate isomerase
MATVGLKAIRMPLMVGNWKMFKTSGEGGAFVRELAARLGEPAGREVMVAPTFTGLYEAVKAAENTCISVAAQDVFWEAEGAYTGEVSAAMLADLGVKAAIIGHSERRAYFGETDEWVAKKVRAALDRGLLPIMCVGESEEDREAGFTENVLGRQVPAGLASVRPEDAGKLAIAYEPVWAIGTGKTATPEIAQEAIAFVRKQVAATLGEEAAAILRILYGGSVSPSNVDELMALPDVDGALVGGASLKLDSFTRIVEFQNP